LCGGYRFRILIDPLLLANSSSGPPVPSVPCISECLRLPSLSSSSNSELTEACDVLARTRALADAGSLSTIEELLVEARISGTFPSTVSSM
jgi:hypothetical protein